MNGGGGHYEHVPDGVEVPNLFVVHQKQSAQRVEHSATDDSPNGGGRYVVEDADSTQGGHPTQCDVAQNGDRVDAMSKKELSYESNDRHDPHRRQQEPPKSGRQMSDRKGRVGCHDHQIDERLVQHAKSSS